jgi:hypothetical protein
MLESKDAKTPVSPSLIARIIGDWLYKKDFSFQKGKPRKIRLDSEFTKLVKGISVDLNPGTILFQLKNAGIVEEVLDKNIALLKLKKEVYSTKDLAEEALKSVSHELNDYYRAITENLDREKALHHHAFTEFDAIPISHAISLQEQLWNIGQELHKKVRELLSSYDSDITSAPKSGRQVRISFGSFAYLDNAKLDGDKNE